MAGRQWPSQDAPPIRVDNTLHLAWGLSLNLSSDENQRAIGSTIKDYWKDLRDKVGNDEKTKNYVDNLFFLIAAYLRTVGFERDVYARQLDVLEKNRNNTLESLNDLADMTSFSTESLIVRISSFLGIGSLADILVTPKTIDPNIILFFGMIGLFGSILLLKWWRHFRIREDNNNSAKQQKKYWERVARPSFMYSLSHLFEDVKELVKVYYPNYRSEPILTNMGEPATTIDRLLPHEPYEPLYYKEEE
jgi:hypothetical protein